MYRGVWQVDLTADEKPVYTLETVFLSKDTRRPAEVCKWEIKEGKYGVETRNILDGQVEWKGVHDRTLEEQLAFIDAVILEGGETVPLVLWGAARGSY